MTQPKHRPARESFTVHVGAEAENATLPEWWSGLDSALESRQLRFTGPDGNWLPDDTLPGALRDAGGRLAEVAETDGRTGLADPTLVVGQPVILRPEPHPSDAHAIAVWSAGQQHVGYVLGTLALETMAESHRLHAAYKAIVVGEQRDSGSGERRSVTILLGPAWVWAEAASE